ncbi:hypothetical protein B484DRAFT_172328 [Ochromonadaceae sp. CCMP2298]|nr:hypothetical protein B484DRAFT_172328 [Ochromonadaceae sp. CCMP2298]
MTGVLGVIVTGTRPPPRTPPPRARPTWRTYSASPRRAPAQIGPTEREQRRSRLGGLKGQRGGGKRGIEGPSTWPTHRGMGARARRAPQQVQAQGAVPRARQPPPRPLVAERPPCPPSPAPRRDLSPRLRARGARAVVGKGPMRPPQRAACCSYSVRRT